MSKYYATVVEILERMSGLSEAEILGGRSELCADYRSMLVELLSKKYTNKEMVCMTGLSRQSVTRITTNHANRTKHKYSMRIAMHEAEQEVSALTD